MKRKIFALKKEERRGERRRSWKPSWRHKDNHKSQRYGHYQKLKKGKGKRRVNNDQKFHHIPETLGSKKGKSIRSIRSKNPQIRRHSVNKQNDQNFQKLQKKKREITKSATMNPLLQTFAYRFPQRNRYNKKSRNFHKKNERPSRMFPKIIRMPIRKALRDYKTPEKFCGFYKTKNRHNYKKHQQKGYGISEEYQRTPNVTVRSSPSVQKKKKKIWIDSKGKRVHSKALLTSKRPRISYEDTFDLLCISSEFTAKLIKTQLKYHPDIFSMQCRNPDYFINREKVIEWVMYIHFMFGFSSRSLHLCINILDRIFAKKSYKRTSIRSVAITALYMALKYEEPNFHKVLDRFFHFYEKSLNLKISDLKQMEIELLSVIEFSLTVTLPYDFLTEYTIKCTDDMYYIALYLLTLGISTNSYMKYLPQYFVHCVLKLASLCATRTRISQYVMEEYVKKGGDCAKHLVRQLWNERERKTFVSDLFGNDCVHRVSEKVLPIIPLQLSNEIMNTSINKNKIVF